MIRRNDETYMLSLFLFLQLGFNTPIATVTLTDHFSCLRVSGQIYQKKVLIWELAVIPDNSQLFV